MRPVRGAPATEHHHFTRLTRIAAAMVVGGAIVAVSALGPDQRHVTADAITDKIAAASHTLAADTARIGQLRAQLAASANTEADLQRAIVALDAQITVIRAQIADAEHQVTAVEMRLSIAQSNLAETRIRLESDQHQLTLELVVLYKSQNASNDFSNFLNSGDFNSLWQHVLDINRLRTSEEQLIVSVNTEQANMQSEVAQISTEKSQKTQLLANLQGTRAQLSDALAAQQQAVVREQALQARDQQLIAQAVASTAALHAQIAKLQAEEAAALAAGGGSGQFAWPETGPITQGFGCTDYPYEPGPPPGYPPCRTGHFHWGIDIAAPWGTPVHAADSGIVNLRSDPWGYGTYIVIFHGNGWDTVYGHMSGYAAGLASGQAVHRGQVIGYEGSTGNSSGPHLHFEIDYNNIPKNPFAYLS
jgi:murein DD-endopeptidase MepM/ murein hydrolase activator NlpD